MTDNRRIDLEWAKNKIHGFAEMMRKAQEVKESEREYKEKYGDKK